MTRAEHRRRARAGRGTGWVLPAGVALVAAAAFGLVLVLGSDEPAPGPAAARIEVTGSLPPFEASPDPAAGMVAPTVRGEDFDGRTVEIARDGRPKGIVFLAHWCSHCRAEVPRVQAWVEAGGAPDGVDLVSVVTGTDPAQPNYPPDAWLGAEGWTLPVIVDDDAGSAAVAYGLQAFPYWVFVDADGRVVARAEGELDVASLEEMLAALG